MPIEWAHAPEADVGHCRNPAAKLLAATGDTANETVAGRSGFCGGSGIGASADVDQPERLRLRKRQLAGCITYRSSNPQLSFPRLLPVQ